VQPNNETHDTTLRGPTLVWGIAAAASIVILISTLETPAFEKNLWLRGALLLVGAIPAVFVLRRLAPGGVIDHRNRRRFLFAVLAVHILATLYFFPIADILNDRPVVSLDHSFHYYQAHTAREVFWETFRLDRYDPYFMAGYPGGTIFDLDMKGAETFCAFSPVVSVARALKWFILCAYLSMIPSIYWGSRMQGFRIEESIFGLLVFLAYWHWGRPYAGDFRYAGMFAYVFAAHLSFLLVGVLRRVARGSLTKTFLGLGPLAFLIHPTSIVMLPVPFVVSIGCDWRLWRVRKWILLAAWCVGVVVINIVWLEPFFKYVWMKTTTELYYQIAGWQGLARLILKPTCAIALGMIFLSILGVVRLAREQRLSTGLPASAGALFLFFIAGWGVFVPGVNQLEPGRFLLGAFVFLAPLAGTGLRWFVSVVLDFVRDERTRSALRSALVVGLVLISLPLSLLESKAFYRHTITTRLTPPITALVDEVSRRVRPPGRLMIEDCPAMYYDDVHLPALLPLTTGVEQIGGPYPHTFLLYYFTSFRWEETFGRPMESWDRDSLGPYLELYDVSWIVTATGQSGRFVTGLLGRPPDWARPPYALWQLERPPAGEQSPAVVGRVNRLEVTGDPTATGYFISYHWVPGLTVSGNARIRAVHRYDDPVPFIYVEPNGDREIIISY